MPNFVGCGFVQATQAHDPDRPIGRVEHGSCSRSRRRSGTGSVPRLQLWSPDQTPPYMCGGPTTHSTGVTSQTLRTGHLREQVLRIRADTGFNLPYGANHSLHRGYSRSCCHSRGYYSTYPSSKGWATTSSPYNEHASIMME
jgi:hypothetical protein